MKSNYERILSKSSMFFLIILATTSLVGACGNQTAIPVSRPAGGFPQAPNILDAWTTNDLNNPYKEVYEFNKSVDTLAFVTDYFHAGGIIPQQYIGAFYPGTSKIVAKCRYDWTIPLPPGEYLLINYYPKIMMPPVGLDWASKVGEVTFGYPDFNNNKRPFNFTIKKQ